MKEVKIPQGEESYGEGEYFSVVDDKGVLRCSCGRELTKLDEETYVCSGGYPVYRFSDGTVVIDKFGNLLIKTEEHTDG